MRAGNWRLEEGVVRVRAGKEKAAALACNGLYVGAQEKTRTSTELPAST